MPGLNRGYLSWKNWKRRHENKICLKKVIINVFFLREVSKKLKLNTEIIQKDIFKVKNIETGTIMSRAFKPMPIILNLIQRRISTKYKNVIFFMGNNVEEKF